MKSPLEVVLVEDDPSFLRVMEFSLKKEGFAVTSFPDGEAAFPYLLNNKATLFITDLAMPRVGGMELLRRLAGQGSQATPIVITAYGTVETAVEAMKLGAFDYLTKPFSPEELVLVVHQALKMRSLVSENQSLKEQLAEKFRPENFVGTSAAMQAVIAWIAKASGSSANALITGESGTGKELVARALHFHSPRASGPFVAINCAAIPENLLEAELFGFVRGAFTGALRDREGKFEEADGGTLFLDEIAELPTEMQAKLLRVLEDKKVTRLGGKGEAVVDFRLVASTNRRLEKLISEKTFREDLYYRLNVLTVELPPLRARREDVPALVSHFFKKFGAPGLRLSSETWPVLQSYPFPGNVRELENVCEQLTVFRRSDEVGISELPEKIRNYRPQKSGLYFDPPEEGLDLEELEKELIRFALDKFGGNQTKAARYLGISRPTLIYRLEKYGLSKEQ
ncbi:MAG: sigma-54 dependent transcriptional regulator [candidate division Zixibacteria bacterium]|nr:sigma-54 dependent transcriptional regulator [candidate division Zixibacteria bacterium]